MALRFGLLGTGHWAQEAHGAALAAHDQAELTGVWGRNPSKAAAVAERFGVRAFHDLDALLEKPLALSTDAARRVVEAVAANGVASLLFFTSRYHPEVAAWLDQVREAGDWHGAYAAWLGSIYHPGSPYAESPWRRSKGALWDVGPHALALALPTLGPVERVTAGGGLGDTVHLVLGHRGGASSTLSLSLSVPTAAATTTFDLYGPRGHALLPPFQGTPVEAFGEAVRQLTAAVAAGTTAHPCDVRFGAEVVAVLDAAQRFLAIPADDRTARVTT